MLSACNDISIRSKPTQTIAIGSSNQGTSSTSHSSTSQRNQTLSQEQSVAKGTATDLQAYRENYKAISLPEISDANALIGNDPKAIALSAFGKTDTQEVGSREVKVDYPQTNRAVVTITHVGVADDSVRGIRYRAELVPTTKSTRADKQWEIVWAGSQVTCQQGRGHQDWSTELCL